MSESNLLGCSEIGCELECIILWSYIVAGFQIALLLELFSSNLYIIYKKQSLDAINSFKATYDLL